MKIRTSATAIALSAVVVTGLATTVAAKDNGKVASSRFVGVPASMTGAAGNIRGVNGGGLPWGIGETEMSLKASGKLELEFENLVFTAGPNAGKNTLPEMRAVVSCLDAANAVVNVMTDPFPVTVATATDPGGDGEIETRLALPQPCFAPVVLITNATGVAWFAVDGL